MFSLSLLCAAFYAGLPVNASCSNHAQIHLSDLRVTRSGILLFIPCVPYILLINDNRAVGICTFLFLYSEDSVFRNRV